MRQLGNCVDFIDVNGWCVQAVKAATTELAGLLRGLRAGANFDSVHLFGHGSGASVAVALAAAARVPGGEALLGGATVWRARRRARARPAAWRASWAEGPRGARGQVASVAVSQPPAGLARPEGQFVELPDAGGLCAPEAALAAREGFMQELITFVDLVDEIPQKNGSKDKDIKDKGSKDAKKK